jgi:hypothetical protein
MTTERNTKPRLRRDSAAEYVRQKHGISCTAGYLAKLACMGGGPVFHKLDNRWVLYAEADLDAWAEGRISGPLQKAKAPSALETQAA